MRKRVQKKGEEKGKRIHLGLLEIKLDPYTIDKCSFIRQTLTKILLTSALCYTWELGLSK